ncbi:mitochondrial carrier [Coniophora puteana RWD-64-598 SS2]|uniref:Mitochondrial carrier n=1 Tax=Coniophora puteana (strain RWD-64-598) TaxID=741705 RepID=A0A5M3MSR2_CONPW|nr:mitochondrial carrier [Coniophora puteana RWD-64-598 SS2]EIW82136.1 mitochondrial carrier [Coniophora puteana RWD-64-598 SS2]
MAKDSSSRPSARAIFDTTLSGEQDRPFIPPLKSDPLPYHPPPHSLFEFREQEGQPAREERLRELWKKLPNREHHASSTAISNTSVEEGKLTPEMAREMKREYEDELLSRCGGLVSDGSSRVIAWPEFRKYAEAKEAELWTVFHDELDLDKNGHLDTNELSIALRKAGITLSPSTLAEFMTCLTSSPHSHSISFQEFRDFLLLLPRKPSTREIYQYYEFKKFLGDDGRGPARVTMEGDVSLSAEDKPPPLTTIGQVTVTTRDESGNEYEQVVNFEEDEEYEDHEEQHDWLQGHTAIKFLLAGGIAGAVSRSCTAPFDRLKIFLITRAPELGGTAMSNKPGVGGLKSVGGAVARIYAEGGVFAFWVGNGLNVLKIFPESAIKFLSYESSKRAFAQYWDHVEDTRDISGTSRFMSGGIGGLTSQLSIYPVETLKTHMMSSAGDRKRNLFDAAKRVYQLGGTRAFYRGLTIGLVGVFPYSAIDMSTFEALKLAYIRSTGKEEPGVLALLAFGSISGSVGATSVYPLNLVRTRLQASGSSGHPQRYTGIKDVVIQTYARDGWRGFYRGLLPTLAKVIPSVSISYVVYEHSKRR